MQTGPRAEVPPRRNQPRGSGRLRGTKHDRSRISITQRRRVARRASRSFVNYSLESRRPRVDSRLSLFRLFHSCGKSCPSSHVRSHERKL